MTRFNFKLSKYKEYTYEERKANVQKAHNIFSENIGKYMDCDIREHSRSCRTNIKHLTGWKLVKISEIRESENGNICFDIVIKSSKGITKELLSLPENINFYE